MATDLVHEISVWVWIGAGLVAIIGGIYGASRWFKAQFRDAVTEVVEPLLGPVNVKLGHLHDCVEKVGREAIEHAAAAASAAGDASTAGEAAAVAATAAKVAVEDQAQAMAVHIEQDADSFGELTDWRSTVDASLHNIAETLADTPAQVNAEIKKPTRRSL